MQTLESYKKFDPTNHITKVHINMEWEKFPYWDKYENPIKTTFTDYFPRMCKNNSYVSCRQFNFAWKRWNLHNQLKIFNIFTFLETLYKDSLQGEKG